MLKKLITLLFSAALAVSAVAQTPATATHAPETTTTVVVTDTDSRDIRSEFQETLRRYPTEVGRVLKLDPTLLANQTYLANYPALAAFLAQHPEVAHSPAFYLESVWVPGDPRAENGSERVWRSTMDGLAIFAVFGLITGVLTWLVRTIIDHRRTHQPSAKDLLNPNRRERQHRVDSGAVQIAAGYRH